MCASDRELVCVAGWREGGGGGGIDKTKKYLSVGEIQRRHPLVDHRSYIMSERGEKKLVITLKSLLSTTVTSVTGSARLGLQIWPFPYNNEAMPYNTFFTKKV